MALRQRARNDEDKQARRARILTEASTLLGTHPYARITMAQVAASSGLAKGTLYLYFRSKEELFLALLEEELVVWFGALRERLGTLPSVNPDILGREFASSLETRHTLSALLVILHTILEQNVDTSAALAFKLRLRDEIHAAGGTLELVWPPLPKGAGPRTLLRMYALLIGMRQIAFPSAVVAAILAREDMASLRIDFTQELTQGIADLLRGSAHSLGGGA
ncbi:MAG: TetR family transcriptional regulator [Nannocystaceae bacterium]|nr:TetR family transcriptional regulator [Nannocystaceae bacterium]